MPGQNGLHYVLFINMTNMSLPYSLLVVDFFFP